MIQSLGKYTTQAGTPICVATPLALAAPQHVHGILIQALAANTGKVFIGDATINRGAQAGLYAVLPAPTATSIPSFSSANAIAPNGIALEDIWIDVDVNGEGVLVSVLVS